MPKPHILILDPAPERDALIKQIHQLGYPLDVAKGLHDAMVQSIIRKPSLIIADLTLADACGHACQQRLEQMPHLKPIPFLTLDNPADGDPQASNQAILDRLEALLPTPTPQTETDDSRENPPAASPQPILADLLAQLATDEASATIAITGAGDNYGEILVRDGVPIHAVVDTGLTGPAAMAAITSMDKVDVSLGQAPHPDAPNTLAEPSPEPPRPNPTALADDDPISAEAPASREPLPPREAQPAPQNADQDKVADAPDQEEVLALLNDLAAFGIVTKRQP